MARRNTNAALEALGQATPETTSTARIVPLNVGTNKKADVARVMLYLPPKVAKKVKEIAFHQDRKPHDIYLEALDDYMKAKGFGGLTDIAAR